ncbi:Tritrans,polycis-undecaprenyl-diphosphate synthase (GGDP specific) [uncultured archaeon]|nr:Tritrans,polycis-undecaprenyl-diphosphate synthase (GGDP specific) [uncultured archaeon]
MHIKNVPKVLALIPDGNRRWALGHSLSFFNGYNLGVKKFIDFADWCKDYGVKNIVVWAFSTENFKRSKVEQEALFNIYRKVANDGELVSRLHENRTRFNIVGNRDLLPIDLVKALQKIEEDTCAYKERVINMLIAYGGRDDILQATAAIVRDAVDRKVKTVSEDLFRTYMPSNGVPDIDLVIRTSGEARLSGFMPWQAGYSELYFSKKLWPDFTRQDLEDALTDYNNRQRRFGV